MMIRMIMLGFCMMKQMNLNMEFYRVDIGKGDE